MTITLVHPLSTLHSSFSWAQGGPYLYNCTLHIVTSLNSITSPKNAGLPRELEGPRANTKCGAHNRDCVRESGGMPPENFENLYAPKCVVHAYSAYIPASCHFV